MTVRVLLADDQALVRHGFRLIVNDAEDMEVVGEAANGEQVVALGRRVDPDVVLMDVRMPVLDGLEATRRLLGAADRRFTGRVLVLTTFDHDEYVLEALRAGASGFLLKDAPPEQLLAGIRAVADGNALLAPSVTRRLIETHLRRAPPPARVLDQLAGLTARELEVLELMGAGLSNAEIAERLLLGEATVKTHVSRVFLKLGLRDRVQAVVFAYEAGLIVPSGRVE
jgi:DNA-binding NarL/FixJ family response regulator